MRTKLHHRSSTGVNRLARGKVLVRALLAKVCILVAGKPRAWCQPGSTGAEPVAATACGPTAGTSCAFPAESQPTFPQRPVLDDSDGRKNFDFGRDPGRLRGRVNWSRRSCPLGGQNPGAGPLVPAPSTGGRAGDTPQADLRALPARVWSSWPWSSPSTPGRPACGRWRWARMATRWRPATGSSPSTSPGPDGSSTTPKRSGRPWRPPSAELLDSLDRAGGGHRHHQPAGDRRRLGPPHRRTPPPRHRLAGPPGRRRCATRSKPPAIWTWSEPAPGWSSIPTSRPASWPGCLTEGGVDAGPDLAFGTVDSWLRWRLTGGRVHATDPTNAVAHPAVRHHAAGVGSGAGRPVRRAAVGPCRRWVPPVAGWGPRPAGSSPACPPACRSAGRPATSRLPSLAKPASTRG